MHPLIQEAIRITEDLGDVVTPRGYKIDIYTKDVSGIPAVKVVATAKDIEVQKGVTLKAASVEVLVVSKFRAAAKRSGTDDVDIRALIQRKYKEINWEALKALTESEIEYQRIKGEMDLLHRMKLNF